MTTTYHLSANDLSEDFLKSLKAMYKGKTISITVETETDETEYLLSSEANRKFLLESMRQAEKGELIKVDIWADVLQKNTAWFTKFHQKPLPLLHANIITDFLKIIFVELYHKNDKENEDRERIIGNFK